MPADQQACAQRLRGASLQLVTVLLRALHVASLPVLPGGADAAADAACTAAAAAAGLPLPPLWLQPPLASLLDGVERGDLCRRATDAGASAGAGAMELSVGAVFTWVLRLWEDELRRGLTVSELRVHLACLERLALHCGGAARHLAAAARRVLCDYAIEQPSALRMLLGLLLRHAAPAAAAAPPGGERAKKATLVKNNSQKQLFNLFLLRSYYAVFQLVLTT